MTLDDYERRLIDIANESLASHRSVHEVVATQTDCRDLAAFRFQLLTDSDVRTWGDLLSTGLFAGQPLDVRLGLLLVTIDAGHQGNRVDLRTRCDGYENSPLLTMVPGLREFVRADLISGEAVTQEGNSDVMGVPGGYGRLDGFLHPFLVAWALGSFPREHVFVRLDPREGGREHLQRRLYEYVVRPPNPKWWKNFGLRRGMTDGGCFLLDPSSTPDSLRDAARWEYSAKGIRRLEVFVKRENQGRFSMMVEELSDRDGHDGIMIGRCIHLDSHSPEGTPFIDVVLDHIDLAVNVYEDANRKARDNQGLQDGGKIVDASCRTHLLRIDHSPFTAIFDLAIGFLQSTTLLHEWFTASFPQDNASDE